MGTNEQRTVGVAPPRDGGASTDDLLEVLSNQRRRYVVARLDEHSGHMAVADVAEDLTSWECGTPRDELTGERISPRYLALHHVHLPKMADAGIIDRDRTRNTVALVDDCDGITTVAALISVE